MLIFIFLLILSATAEWGSLLECMPCKCLVIPELSADKFTNLKTVECFTKSNLTSVPSDFPTDIQYIHINGGRIRTLAGTEFNPYKNLSLMLLRNNQLTYIPNSLFSNTINIQTINLSDNKIKTLQSNLFTNLKLLENIGFSGNQITSIEDNCFVNVPLLNFMDFSRNRLTKINERFIDDLSSVTNLYFHENPVHCDETICELMNLVVHREMWAVDKDISKCATPNSVKDKTWPEAVEFLWGKGLERCPKARRRRGTDTRLTEVLHVKGDSRVSGVKRGLLQLIYTIIPTA